jgi:hypothetical protein
MSGEAKNPDLHSRARKQQNPRSNSAANHMESNQHHDGSDHGNEKTVQIQASYARFAKSAKEPSSDHRPDDPQNDIEE